MPKRHYTIYCDESAKKGRHFSNFYGGALVSSADREAVEDALIAKKEELNFFKEVKWTSVTGHYLEKYEEFIKYYFSFVRTGRIKVRVMFSQNMYRPAGLSAEQIDSEYFLLYYQMIKHAFGLAYCNPNGLDKVYCSLLLDDLPDTREKSARFKQYLAGLSDLKVFRDARVIVPYEQIAEVDSKKHNILQGLDIIMGSMNFRLNDLHKEKPEGSRVRGKRTIAKEKLYKAINREISSIYPNFNIGASTGTKNGIEDRWHHPYRHWVFRPTNHRIDLSAVKGKPR